jgi:hypothetical protein
MNLPLHPEYDPKIHGCLRDFQLEHPLPFVYAEAQNAAGGPKVKRWMLQAFTLDKQHRIDKATQTLKAITFCPFCGMLLAIGQPEDLLPVTPPEEIGTPDEIAQVEIQVRPLEDSDPEKGGER